MRTRILSLLAFLMVLLSQVSFAQGPLVKDGNRVKKAALDWLELLETKEYSRSWQATSELFKQHTQQRDWVIRAKGFHAKLGALVYRRLVLLGYDGSPETRLLCTATFQTQYENMSFQRESVLLIFEEDDWRVAGYYVK